MTDRLQVLARSYLDHVRIAVQARDRGAPFRDFFDNWNAYQTGHNYHRSRGERPRWFNNPSVFARADMLNTLDFKSARAEDILALAQADPPLYRRLHKARDRAVRLVVDHSIPIGVMVEMLLQPREGEQVELSYEGLENFLSRWYRLGLITFSENDQIDKAKLRSRMPHEWDRADHFARYWEAGIAASEQPK